MTSDLNSSLCPNMFCNQNKKEKEKKKRREESPNQEEIKQNKKLVNKISHSYISIQKLICFNLQFVAKLVHKASRLQETSHAHPLSIVLAALLLYMAFLPKHPKNKAKYSHNKNPKSPTNIKNHFISTLANNSSRDVLVVSITGSWQLFAASNPL